MSNTSRYIEIRPDNIPASGKISFKNGFPVLSFTISAQNGMLDPSSIRIVGDFAAYKDNATTPTRLVDGDGVSMNNRLGIYNVIESVTIRAARSKMICESIRSYSKFMNTYLAVTSSLQDQLGHLSQTCLIQPNVEAFRKSVMENASNKVTQTNPFSFHIPCGFCQSGNLVNLREDAFGGVQIEFQLQPDSNVLYKRDGTTTGIGDAHYELSNLKLTCEISDIPDSELVNGESQGVYEYNTITSLYTSINSTNAQIQYSLGLSNVISAFMTFMPVSHINTLTADGMATTYPSGNGVSSTALAPIRRVQFLKGGVKYPADFDYVNNIIDTNNTATEMPDPEIVKNLVKAVHPDSTMSMMRMATSVANMNRDYSLATDTGETSYASLPEGGAIMGLGVKYGIGEAGEDFSQQQWGVSIESDLKSDNPQGVFIFIKSRAQLLYSPTGVQLRQ